MLLGAFLNGVPNVYSIDCAYCFGDRGIYSGLPAREKVSQYRAFGRHLIFVFGIYFL